MHGVKRLLWWLLSGSAGGINRGRILQTLFDQPRNANEMTTLLSLDCKTVRHHLSALEKNHLMMSTGSEFEMMYFPSDLLEKNQDMFAEIWSKIRKNK